MKPYLNKDYKRDVAIQNRVCWYCFGISVASMVILIGVVI